MHRLRQHPHKRRLIRSIGNSIYASRERIPATQQGGKTMTDKKFELTETTIGLNNITLYRIKALRDFADVKAGDLG
jgi:hypothetical protein